MGHLCEKSTVCLSVKDLKLQLPIFFEKTINNCLNFSKIVDVIMVTCKKETKQVLLCPRMMQWYCTYTYTEAAASSTAVLSAVHSISLQILERDETKQLDFKKR